MSAYIFRIGMLKYKEWQRAQAKISDYPENYLLGISDQNKTNHEERRQQEDEHFQNLKTMQIALNELGQNCKKTLELFYLEKKSMIEIAKKMGYSNKDTAKNMKYKCLKQLQKLYKKIS